MASRLRSAGAARPSPIAPRARAAATRSGAASVVAIATSTGTTLESPSWPATSMRPRVGESWSMRRTQGSARGPARKRPARAASAVSGASSPATNAPKAGGVASEPRARARPAAACGGAPSKAVTRVPVAPRSPCQARVAAISPSARGALVVSSASRSARNMDGVGSACRRPRAASMRASGESDRRASRCRSRGRRRTKPLPHSGDWAAPVRGAPAISRTSSSHREP